jgi:hypothetical protein
MLKNLKVALANPLKEKGGAGAAFRSWAIQYKPSELEQLLWRSRNVNIYDMRIEDFVGNMRRYGGANR